MGKRSVAAKQGPIVDEHDRPQCILCRSFHGDPHPAFAAETLKWADYQVVSSASCRRRLSEAAGAQTSPSHGPPRGPICDVCNRTLPLWRCHYWRTSLHAIARTASLREEFLRKRQEYIIRISRHRKD